MTGRPSALTLAGAACTALLLALPAAYPAYAQRVEAYLSTDSITVGDRFTLTLVSVNAAEQVPQFPDSLADASVFGDLELIGPVATGRRVRASDGATLDSVVYEVTTFALDTAFVPPIRVVYSVDEDTLSAAAPALMLPVTSLVPPDAEGIKDLAPLVEFPRPLWPFILLALAVLVLLATLWYYLRERRRPVDEPAEAPPPPQISPYDAALQRLQTLEADNPAENGQAKPFFVELSDVLRTYLEDRLGVPALERTTRELLHELDGRTVRHKLPGPAPRQVQSLLTLADLVKFADHTPPADQSRAALAETRETIDGIETKIRQIEHPAPPLIVE